MSESNGFTITFSYPHNFRNLHQDFFGARDALMIHEWLMKKKKDRILGSLLNQGSCYIEFNRAGLIRDFINHSFDSHLLMIDPDIPPPQNLLEEFERIVFGARAQGIEPGILAARVNLRNGLPVFYMQHPDKISTIHQVQPFLGIKEFDFVGTGCILLSRQTLVDLCARNGHPYLFNLIIEPETGRLLGDDLSFCKRARDLGHKVYGTWEINLLHYKDYPCPNNYPSLEQVKITKR